LPKPLPTLLEFRIDDAQNFAKDCAAHAMWASLPTPAAGERVPLGFIPFQHDGEDARAVINWNRPASVERRPVGMYGEGYSGFVPWAAAKRLPPALKPLPRRHPSHPE